MNGRPVSEAKPSNRNGPAKERSRFQENIWNDQPLGARRRITVFLLG